MLRIRLLGQLFGHSDPAIEVRLHGVPRYRDFAHLDTAMSRMPDKSTMLRFGHLPEAQSLAPKILNCINAKLAACGLLLKPGTVGRCHLDCGSAANVNNMTRGRCRRLACLHACGQAPGAGQAIALVQFVDGQKVNYSGSAGISAPAARAIALKGPAKAANKGHCIHKIAGNKFLVSIRGFLTVNSRHGGSCAELPDCLNQRFN